VEGRQQRRHERRERRQLAAAPANAKQHFRSEKSGATSGQSYVTDKLCMFRCII
jgi:hypothetical protein